MLHIKQLRTLFQSGSRTVTAVDGVSITIPPSKMVGLVGESGSGKSVTALSTMRLLPKSATTTGKVEWNNQNILTLKEPELRSIRGKEIALIFQNPLAALNPVFTIGNQMIETICLHHPHLNKHAAKNRAIELLSQVHIPDPKHRINQYPHELSLGMCQRVMIALTISMNPQLLIADEPTASLDVTVQSQIMTLIKEIQSTYEMSVLLISHDLGIIAQNCDYIYIMYLGRVVEEGPPEVIFTQPQHPYTQALIAAIPDPNPNNKSTPNLIEGDIPSPLNLPKGCRFHTRCPHVMPKCIEYDPTLTNNGTSTSACFLNT